MGPYTAIFAFVLACVLGWALYMLALSALELLAESRPAKRPRIRRVRP